MRIVQGWALGLRSGALFPHPQGNDRGRAFGLRALLDNLSDLVAGRYRSIT